MTRTAVVSHLLATVNLGTIGDGRAGVIVEFKSNVEAHLKQV